MRIFLLTLLLLIVPTFAFGEELSDCDTDTVQCICTPEDLEPAAYPSPITETEDCQSYCSLVQSIHPEVTGYSVQCSISGSITTIGQGNSDGIMNDGFNNYYYEDPQLGVEIPGLEFSGAYQDDDTFVSNYLGEYVAAVYAWLIPTASLLVVLVIMVGGLQWMLARGDSGRIGKAKERIKNAVTGLILLMGAYTFTYIVDPSLSSFDPFTTNLVAQKLEEDTSGAGEGISGGAIAADCEEAVTNALGSGACTMSESLGSPTGDVVSCNYHFVDKSYNWANINSLDYVGQWDSSVYAPFTGTVTHFFDSAGNACGNGIKLSGSGGAVYLCHLKDWGGTTSGQSVSKGDVIGHVGGRCCAGENPPSDWSAASYCTYTGTECSTGNSQESCDCQAWEQSGNTTGGHVHLTYISGGNMIACFDESNY